MPLPPELMVKDFSHQAYILKWLIRSFQYRRKPLNFGMTNRILQRSMFLLVIKTLEKQSGYVFSLAGHRKGEVICS